MVKNSRHKEYNVINIEWRGRASATERFHAWCWGHRCLLMDPSNPMHPWMSLVFKSLQCRQPTLPCLHQVAVP
eukprot:4745727-Lingulodinium_polyedra.AAC.1